MMNSQTLSQQKTEFNVQDFPMVHMAAIHKSYNVILANEFRNYDVTPQMWRVMVMLQAKDGYSIGYLSDITLIEQSHLSRIVETMEGDDLVIRQAQSRDKRIRQVHITPKGRALFEELLPLVLAQYDIVLTGFSQSETAKLMEFLLRIRVNIRSTP
jgi:DNA-binding MarR family transcriptional regulator